MKVHQLKIWPQYYAAVKDGTKTFEFRQNDRNFRTGDVVVLQCWNPRTKDFDASKVDLIFDVGFIFPVGDKYSILSINNLRERKQ